MRKTTKRNDSCNLQFSKQTRKHNSENGQAKKSVGRMPWHQEPTKDVISCDKLRGRASIY